jgi:hypothetical protein
VTQARLYDVSIVSRAAYPAAGAIAVSQRALAQAQELRGRLSAPSSRPLSWYRRQLELLERAEVQFDSGQRLGGPLHRDRITAHVATPIADYRPLEWQWLAGYIDVEPSEQARRYARLQEVDVQRSEQQRRQQEPKRPSIRARLLGD